VKHRQHFLFLFIVLLILLLIIFSETLRNFLFELTKLDTIGHFISFFCLALVVNSLLKLPLFTSAISLSFYAALSEIGQYYLGFRHGEFRDFVADVLGILFFVLLKWLYIKYWKKRVA
jgi:VanZ family protein